MTYHRSEAEEVSYHAFHDKKFSAKCFGAVGISCMVAAGIVAQPIIAPVLAVVGSLALANTLYDIYEASKKHTLWKALVEQTNIHSTKYKATAETALLENTDKDIIKIYDNIQKIRTLNKQEQRPSLEHFHNLDKQILKRT